MYKFKPQFFQPIKLASPRTNASKKINWRLLLKTFVIALWTTTFFVSAAEARLMAGGPETVIANSPLVLTGKVTESMVAVEERMFTVKVDHVIKGGYQKERLVLTEKKNPVYGWVHIRRVPEINTELLLFLRNDGGSDPYFAFDLNCIALLEGQEVTGLLSGSNVGINDEHWEIADYIREYNAYFSGAEPAETQTDAADTTASRENVPLFSEDNVNREKSFDVDADVDINEEISTKNGSSIGIIGSADGPTAVYVSENPLKAIIVPAIVLAAILFTVGFAVGYIVKGKRVK